MQTESDALATHTDVAHDLDGNELDRTHEAFLAEIVHLDGNGAQRLFKKIAEDATDEVPVLSDHR